MNNEIPILIDEFINGSNSFNYETAKGEVCGVSKKDNGFIYLYNTN